MANFASRLKDIMDMKGITQLWLSKRTNIPEATISRYVCGIHTPKIDNATRIANALNVSVDYLTGTSIETAPHIGAEEDVIVLSDAYRRADDDRKHIVWAALSSCLTPAEKEAVSANLNSDEQ